MLNVLLPIVSYTFNICTCVEIVTHKSDAIDNEQIV